MRGASGLPQIATGGGSAQQLKHNAGRGAGQGPRPAQPRAAQPLVEERRLAQALIAQPRAAQPLVELAEFVKSRSR